MGRKALLIRHVTIHHRRTGTCSGSSRSTRRSRSSSSRPRSSSRCASVSNASSLPLHTVWLFARGVRVVWCGVARRPKGQGGARHRGAISLHWGRAKAWLGWVSRRTRARARHHRSATPLSFKPRRLERGGGSSPSSSYPSCVFRTNDRRRKNGRLVVSSQPPLWVCVCGCGCGCGCVCACRTPEPKNEIEHKIKTTKKQIQTPKTKTKKSKPGARERDGAARVLLRPRRRLLQHVRLLRRAALAALPVTHAHAAAARAQDHGASSVRRPARARAFDRVASRRSDRQKRTRERRERRTHKI